MEVDRVVAAVNFPRATSNGGKEMHILGNSLLFLEIETHLKKTALDTFELKRSIAHDVQFLFYINISTFVLVFHYF